MNDLLEILQADLTAILKASPALADAVILADNEGDIESKVQRALSPIKAGGTDKRGLAVVVLLPEVDEAEQNLPGPPLRVRCEIRTLENVSANRSSHGSGMRSSQAALAVLAALHHQVLGGHSLYAQKDPVVPVDVKAGHVSHAVTLYVRPGGLQGPGKPEQVDVSIAAGVGQEGIIVTGSLTKDGSTPLVFPALLPPDAPRNGRPAFYAEEAGDEFGSLWETTSNPFTGIGDFTGWFLKEDTEGVIWASTADVASPSLVPPGPWHADTNPHGWRPVSPATGTPVVTSSGASTITLTCATSGASIYYTTDGSYPTPAAGTLYSAPFAMPEAGTLIRAAAYKSGLNPGDCLEFTVTE